MGFLSGKKDKYNKLLISSDVHLKINVVKARNLTDVDKTTVKSPYVVVRGNHYRLSTSTNALGANAEWNTNFHIPLQPWSGPYCILFTAWDKTSLRKTYLGESQLELSQLFKHDIKENKWMKLNITNADEMNFDSGEIEVCFSLVSKTKSDEDIVKIWKALVYFMKKKKSRKGLVAELNDNQEFIISEEDEIEAEEGEEEEEEYESSLSSGKGDSQQEDNKSSESSKSDSTNTQIDVEDEDYLSPIEEDIEITDKTNKMKLNDKKIPDKPKRKRIKKHRSYELNLYSDIIGMAFLDIVSVTDLPAPRNITGTSFDMDPFVVITFGKKTFRTPHKRHNLNPVYNEKLLFPVRKNESRFSIKFTVMDNDKFSLHDFVGEVEINMRQLLANSPSANPRTGLYEPMLKDSVLSEEDVETLVLPLRMDGEKYGDIYCPELIVRVKFLPYAALRQQLWRGLIVQYDTDDTKSMSSVELNTMLDTLGSTLSLQTRMQFFERFNKDFETDDLTIDETIMCLEEQILKDTEDQKRRGSTASMMSMDSTNTSLGWENGLANSSSASLSSYPDYDPNSVEIINGAITPPSPLVERVIRLSVCPVCNEPRLRKRSEVDLVSHIATCASLNWSKVDAAMLDKYVTPNQAKSRWYTAAVKKLTYGNYKLGANSANILVQDRETGYVMEEKMSIYVRVGIRLLYKGIRNSGMERKKIRNLLRSLSIKQGKKYDSPSSIQSIVPFIKFHNLDMSESLEPAENFKTFNQFFYRKLKPDVRKLDAPDENHIGVSPADCRCSVFPSVSKAQEIWIKGRPFSIARLLGDKYPEYVDKFIDGPLAIFRLAPQDYHRFHSPVSGIIGKPKQIEGEYYTVNPMAIRSSLDVFGENVRVLVPIESEEFGSVMVICVGAMMVGSTVITAKEGSCINRMDELGYFQFGGSTLVILFEPGKMIFDRDLEENSLQPLETLVRVGMSVGHSPLVEEWERNDLKSPELASPEQLRRARRVISGLPS